MDAKPQNAELEALIRRNDLARRAVADQWQLVRRRIDLPTRLSDHIRGNRTLWFAASTTLGLVASAWFRKKTPASQGVAPARKGLFGLALATAFSLAKPAIKTWLWNEFQKRYLSRNTLAPRAKETRHFSD
ncbi:MAG: hypothetical protein RI957_434 [Verrucomicrobiota bacterium]|jgi:hypothetical protein